MYRLQVNALRVFLQEKIKQIEDKKSAGDPEQQATLLRAVNDILEEELSKPKLIKTSDETITQDKTTESTENLDKRIQERAQQIADKLLSDKTKEINDTVVKLELENENLQKSIKESEESDEEEDAEYEETIAEQQKTITEQGQTIDEQSEQIEKLKDDVESHASHKDEILQALSTIGQIRPSGSPTKPPTKTLKPIITDKEKQQQKTETDTITESDTAPAPTPAPAPAPAPTQAQTQAPAPAPTTAKVEEKTKETAAPATAQVEETIEESVEKSLDDVEDTQLKFPEGSNTETIGNLLGNKMDQIKRSSSWRSSS